MKNSILCNQSITTENTSSQANTPNTNSEVKMHCSCSISTIAVGDGIIIVPKPIRASGPQWMNYVKACNESKEISIEVSKEAQEKSKVGMKMSKEERASKVQRFLEKRRKRNGIKKIRYQYRQQVAARRIRYHGRFIKIEQAKELILKGELVDANDKTELNKLFEELKENNMSDEYKELTVLQKPKDEFKNTQDTNIKTNNIINTRKFSSSTSGGTNSGTSPLIQVMKDGNLSGDTKETNGDVESSPPVLKL